MRTLLAGFGNLLLGDDGFGVEVVRRLSAEGLPAGTEALEVGIGGFDFVLKLMDRFDRAIIVDAMQRNQKPGTLYVFEPAKTDVALATGERIDPHFAEPTRAMTLARRLAVLPERVTVIACEPHDCDLRLGLSDVVESAVGPAMTRIREIMQSSEDHGTR